MSPLRRLLAALRPRPQIPGEELSRYGEALAPLLSQLGSLYRAWRRDLELNTGEDELANTSSIQRWEAAGLVDRIQAVQPPEPLTRTHSALVTAAQDTTRAARLLSSGYRFHSSSARCDGHALMLETEARYVALRRELADWGLSVPPDGDGAAPAAR
jgi:hypothetical protein